MSKKRINESVGYLKYSLSKKYKSPRNPEKGEVWVANPQAIGTLSCEQFLDQIAAGDIKLKAQLKSDLELITTRLRGCLRMGYNVDLGNLGKYSFTYKCDPWEGDEEGFKPNARIKQVKTVWKPGKMLKDLKQRDNYDGPSEIAFKKVPSRAVQQAGIDRVRKSRPNDNG